MMKQLVVTALLVFSTMVISPLQAAYPPPPPGAYGSGQGNNSQPLRILQHKLSRIQAFVQDNPTHDPASALRFLQDELAQVFALDRMAQWIAGPYYPRMSVEERAKFQNRLKENMLTAISRQLGIFRQNDLKMDFYPPRRTGRAEVTVMMRLMHPEQPPIRLAFKFHPERDGEWKVYDVSIDGLSAMSYYRDYYRQAVGNYGPVGFYR